VAAITARGSYATRPVLPRRLSRPQRGRPEWYGLRGFWVVLFLIWSALGQGRRSLRPGVGVLSERGLPCLLMSRRKAKRADRGPAPRGLRYGPGGYGKHEFRVREQYVVDHLVPLMRSRAVGAAKLDLVLRGVALPYEHRGARTVGFVLPGFTYERLHDLARPATALEQPRRDGDASPDVLRLKRKWVGEQIVRLQERGLVKRVLRPGRSPALTVLRDDGSGKPLDDPDGAGDDKYVRIVGGVIARGALARWGAPELTAYLAAMVGERHADAARGFVRRQPGTGQWFRPLGWFADRDGAYGSEMRLRLPFAVPTLERGMVSLEEQGLLHRQRITINPRTHQRLKGPRILYRNNFYSQDDARALLSEEEYRDALHADAAVEAELAALADEATGHTDPDADSGH